MRSPVVLMAMLAVTGCASSNIQVSTPIDQSQKTITAPPGSSLLLGSLKQTLRSSGWRISVNRATTRTVGTVGAATDIETGPSLKTRYRLALVQRQVDVCLSGYPMVAYDLSVVDNNSGDEIVTASGRDCTDIAARSFASAINSNGKSYCTSTLGRGCTSREMGPTPDTDEE